MAAGAKRQRSGTSAVAGWSASGMVIGFAIGYLLLDGIVSGVILGIGLGLAMGLGGKEQVIKTREKDRLC